MQGKSNVGICIPTRNQAEYIAETIESAFKQTLLPCDVVVSDDAGTDATEEVVAKFRSSLAPELRPLLRYARVDTPLGIGGNFDRAVRLTRGDFVVKLDSDDLLEAQFVEILGNHLRANPETGWAHCNVINIHPNGDPIALAHTRKRSGVFPAKDALFPYLRHNDTCHCVMLRKSAYLAVGGYRPEMKTCEDWMLWLEMLLSGWGYVFDDRPLARMRKYEARPELMTRRRRDFVSSVRIMVPQIENLCRQKVPDFPGLTLDAALQRFRSATAKLCASSGCDESDPQVRKSLFEAAWQFHPSVANGLWLRVGSHLPAKVTRLGARIAGTPRQCVRLILQKLRPKQIMPVSVL